jgi:hypothetical protein
LWVIVTKNSGKENGSTRQWYGYPQLAPGTQSTSLTHGRTKECRFVSPLLKTSARLVKSFRHIDDTYNDTFNVGGPEIVP